MNACGDSRLRGLRSRKPIGFRQWVVHIAISLIVLSLLVWFASYKCSMRVMKKKEFS